MIEKTPTSSFTIKPLLTTDNDNTVVDTAGFVSELGNLMQVTDAIKATALDHVWSNHAALSNIFTSKMRSDRLALTLGLKNNSGVSLRYWRCAITGVFAQLKALSWRWDVYSDYRDALMTKSWDSSSWHEFCRAHSTWKSKQIRNQVDKWFARNPGKELPQYYELLVDKPSVYEKKLTLGSADGQVYEKHLVGNTIILRMKINGAWWQLFFEIPEYFSNIHNVASINAPELRVVDDELLATFSVTESVWLGSGKATDAIGLDWGLTTFYTATHVHRDRTKLTAQSAWDFDDLGLIDKLERLAVRSERLWAKIRKLEQFPTARNLATIELLEIESVYVNAKRRNIGRELASLVASWAIDLAKSTGSTIIAMEDLTKFEGNRKSDGTNNGGRKLRKRISTSVRGRVGEVLRHRGEYRGIEVVEVPAANTSSHTPCCDADTTHKGGWKFSQCPQCGLEGDRDAWAGANIAKRAIIDRKKIVRPRGKIASVKKVNHRKVNLRDKLTPTSSRPRYKRVRPGKQSHWAQAIEKKKRQSQEVKAASTLSRDSSVVTRAVTDLSNGSTLRVHKESVETGTNCFDTFS